MEEIWRPVRGTNDYLYVSNLGRVRSNWSKGKILKPTPDKKGYLRLKISRRNVVNHFKIHRIVAQAFIPNPDNLPQVNHINGDKSDNRVENLEWMSNRDNAHHAIRTGLWDNCFKAARAYTQSKKTPIYSIDALTGECRNFESVSQAERFFNSRHISDVLNGRRRKAAGQYFFREGVIQQHGEQMEDTTNS